ncbi:MAG: hypothetical protein V4494_00705 [Chlamydiota bacterium]
MASTIFSSKPFAESIDNQCQNTFHTFKKICKFHTFFHIGFGALAIGELLGFLLFFSFFTQSSILAFSLAALFLTGFTYFVLLFYFQAKKPEQLSELRRTFIKNYALSIHFPRNTVDFHITLAHGASQLVHLLDKQEYCFYALPRPLNMLNPVLQKFSALSHWKDVFEMKEQLLFVRAEQHVEQIKLGPTDLESHASLAAAYLQLSRLYRDPRKLHPEQSFPWVSSEYSSELMFLKFKKVCERAIEEYKILDAYVPNSPWVYAELAAIYHDLEQPEEEIRCYETMLKISANDEKILFRLGVLYFQQGLNAKALRIYEILSSTDEADELISYYNAWV